MMIPARISKLLFPLSLALASCSASADVDTSASSQAAGGFTPEERARFDEPWAAAFVPGTDWLAVTEKRGAIRLFNTETGQKITVSNVPKVDYGGQGGLGDIAFLTSESSPELGERTIYLSWAEAGERGTRGAVLGRGRLACEAATHCALRSLKVIWRQQPKVKGRGHYSHRILLSPDEEYLFVASGERQKGAPAQDTSNNLGSIVRLTLDGKPAQGNPLAAKGAPSNQLYSWGHRNILGMDWDAEGRLWEVEHGPAGGDELNLVERGANYGWPIRSFGNHYSGAPIANHESGDGFSQPALSWTPVIAPSDMLFYRGGKFADWRGDALITGLASAALVRVRISGESAREIARYGFDSRLRAIAERADGTLWVLEDGPDARLLELVGR